jgi:hypothetical protein
MSNVPSRTTDQPRIYQLSVESNAKYWTAIVTYRGENIRIISVRRARKSEVELYEGKGFDLLDFIIENGRLYAQSAAVDLRSLSGLLYEPDRKPVSLEEIDAAIVQDVSYAAGTSISSPEEQGSGIGNPC